MSEESYKCFADETGHVRSYSMSGSINRDRYTSWYGIPFMKNPFLTPSPRKTMLFLEEDDPRWFNMGSYVPGGWGFWVDNVAGFHETGINVAFMDGHIEYRKWEDPETPNRFLERSNFRSHSDMIYLMSAMSAGQRKP